MGLLTARTVKKIRIFFTNETWWAAGILKTVKSPYLCNRSTVFDEIWHGDAHCSLTADRPLKFRIKKQDGSCLCYGFTDLYEVWCGDAKWALGSLYHFGPLSPGIAGTADS